MGLIIFLKTAIFITYSMATRSRIGMVMNNGKIKSIYCHWDGDMVGKILRKYYINPAKIKRLMALGNISSLGKNIGIKHNFDNSSSNECNAYGRDRGDKGENARVSISEIEFVSLANSSGADYIYLWNGKRWVNFSN